MTEPLKSAIDYLNQGKTNEALQLLESDTDAVSSEQRLYVKAIALARLGRRTEAIDTLDTLLAHHPSHLKAQQLKAELLFVEQQTHYPTASNRAIFEHPQSFYGNVLLNPSTIADAATSMELWQELLSFHHQLATDEYVAYLDAYYRECLRRFGPHWHYLDIVNVLYASAKLLQPANYLEIGVRRGRSVCVVAKACPTVNIFAFDMWMPNYAGMDNPGATFVANELKKVGHQGSTTFIDGDSHQTIPQFFRDRPQLQLDLITVDGDHSEAGALDDLCNVVPHLALGGVIVFDDIAHPQHPYLLEVWRKMLAQFPQLKGLEFSESGYGIGFAIKTSE